MINNSLGQEIIEEGDYIKDLANRLEKYSENYYRLGKIGSEIKEIGHDEVMRGERN